MIKLNRTTMLMLATVILASTVLVSMGSGTLPPPNGNGTNPPPNTWVLIISSGSGGSVNPSGTKFVAAGQTINVYATANNGYSFLNWKLDGNTFATNPITVGVYNVGTSHTLTASFTSNQLPPQIGVWYGGGADYLFWQSYSQAYARWQNVIPKYKHWGFNTVRLCFAFPDSGARGASILNYQYMDNIIQLLGSNGIKVILDLHNYIEYAPGQNDMEGYFFTPAFYSAWQGMAQHYVNSPVRQYIVGYEIANEPSYNFGSNYNAINSGVLQTINIIRAVDPSMTIVLPFLDWSLPNISQDIWNKGNVIATFHMWDSSPGMLGGNYVPPMTQFNQRAPQLRAYVNAFGASRVWLGEVGSSQGPSVEYTVAVINLCLELGIGFNWLEYEAYQSGYDAGIQQSNW